MFIQRTFIFSFCLLFSFLIQAQEQKNDNALPQTQLDSATSTTLDTLKSTIALDTLQSATSKIDSAQHALESRIDNLQSPGTGISALDSAQQATQAKIDSLQALNLPHEKYVQKLDSLSKVPENKINEQVQKVEQKVREKAENVKDKLTDKVADDEVQEKLSGEELPELPGELPKVEGAEVPGADINTGEIIPEDVKQEVDLDLKDKMKVDSPVDISEQTEKVDEIKSFPGEKIEKVKESGGINEASDQLDKIGETTEQVSGYQEDLNKARAGDMEGVEQRMEEQAVQIDEVEELQKQSAEIEKLKQEQESYRTELEGQKYEVTQYSDPEFVKQRILEKSKHVVADDVLGQYKSKIAAAREQLAVVDKPELKMDSLQKMLKVKKANDLKDKPLRERIKPGFQLEVNKQFYTTMDFNGIVGYRINDKLKIYGGYLYRFTFDNENNSFLFRDHTYGPRMQVSYQFYKGFFLSAAVDQIRTDVPSGVNATETVRAWVHGGYLGIGREYAFVKRVKGNVQIMYNFLHNSDSPYSKKFNIRFGFEFDLTKRKKARFKIPKDKSFRQKVK